MSPLLERTLALYRLPLFELIDLAHQVHRQWHDPSDVQRCVLLSIKTGGCSEDCGYCAQSSRYQTGVKAEPLMQKPEVMAAAVRAKENGSTRFCMGAAWKGVRAGDRRFEQVLDIVRSVSKLGMEVCVTLGQLSSVEARQLADRLQPQSRHVPGVLSRDCLDPHLRGSIENDCGGPGIGHVGVLRRHHRHG